MQVAIVEDDPIIAKAVSTAVGDAGHACRWIPNGDVALRDESLLGSDVIILDLMLPGADGLDVLRSARSRGIRTPVIVLTARGLVPEKLQAFEAGADDYL
ncbi:MAG: response regulator, partial [Pirellulales bacterium]